VTKQPNKRSGSPYRILFWLGAGVLILLAGILALVLLRGRGGEQAAPDPERTLLWIYDDAAPAGPAALTVIRESRGGRTLTAVPFPAPEDARQAYGGSSGRTAQNHLGSRLGLTLHHRVFMPYSVVKALVDAAGGINVNGQAMSGDQVVAFIREGGDESALRATGVLLALAQAVTQNGVNMSAPQALQMARKVDTDLDLTKLPTVLGRWSQYDQPRVTRPAAVDYQTLAGLLK